MDETQPQTQPDVFEELKAEDLMLQAETEVFKFECIKLAAKNGAGDGIRRRIRKSITKLLVQPRWVE